jgi:hypothetical protein
LKYVAAAVGVTGFAFLMTVREAFSSVALRSLLAALAFAFGAASFLVLAKSGR